MSGIMRTMVSPSISSSRRNTPCVEGCCGPMFRIMVLSSVGSSTGLAFKWPILPIALHRIILAQRMAFPVFRHHDAAEVRMAKKAHAEQIEQLALKKVYRRPDRGDRLDRRIMA